MIDERSQIIRKALVSVGLGSCKVCGRELDEGDVAWNGLTTEAGTDHSEVMVHCQCLRYGGCAHLFLVSAGLG